MGKGYTDIHERLTALETHNINQTKQINEILKILVGNGKPGLVTEWNEWRGGVKFFCWASGVFLTVLSVCVGALALYVK